MWGRARGPTNDDEGFFVSADLKCFRKGSWGWGGGPTNDGKGLYVSIDFKCFRNTKKVEPFLSQIFVD